MFCLNILLYFTIKHFFFRVIHTMLSFYFGVFEISRKQIKQLCTPICPISQMTFFIKIFCAEETNFLAQKMLKARYIFWSIEYVLCKLKARNEISSFKYEEGAKFPPKLNIRLGNNNPRNKKFLDKNIRNNKNCHSRRFIYSS